jgi:hypothetical protein
MIIFLNKIYKEVMTVKSITVIKEYIPLKNLYKKALRTFTLR